VVGTGVIYCDGTGERMLAVWELEVCRLSCGDTEEDGSVNEVTKELPSRLLDPDEATDEDCEDVC
jgi:hypothetical protein